MSEWEDVRTLQFHEQSDGRRVAHLHGKAVLVNFDERERVEDGDWWLVGLDHRETFAIAYLIEPGRAPPDLAVPRAPSGVSEASSTPAASGERRGDADAAEATLRVRGSAQEVPAAASPTQDEESVARPNAAAAEDLPVPDLASSPIDHASRTPRGTLRVQVEDVPDPGECVSARDRIALFVDVANIDHAARKAGFFVDWKRVKDFFGYKGVHYASFMYVPSFPEEDPARLSWLDFLSHTGYVVRTKTIKRVTNDESGETFNKANLDVEIVLDMMTTAENWDVAFLFSGDGDFRRAVEHLRSRGKRVFVVSGRGSLARELAWVADKPIFLLESLRDQVSREDRSVTTDVREAAS